MLAETFSSLPFFMFITTFIYRKFTEGDTIAVDVADDALVFKKT